MRRSIRLGRAAAIVLTLLALTTTSCGPRQERLAESGASLEGTIKYGGEPLQFALVLVQTAKGAATGRIGEDGRYRVENVPLGEVMIGVNTAAAQGEFQSKAMAAGLNKGPEGKGKGKIVGPKFIQIPVKYYSPDTSDLKTTIVKGTNTFDIDIPNK